MKIRVATLDDISAGMELFEEFHKETIQGFGIPYNRNTIIRRMVYYISDELCYVLETEDKKVVGFIAGIITSLMFDVNTTAWIEAGWFVKKEHRKHGTRLLQTVERYCKRVGINKMLIGNTGMADYEKYKKFYGKKGYVPFENHYIKTITNGVKHG